MRNVFFPLNQGLPFHSTIVQKEFTHIVYAQMSAQRGNEENVSAFVRGVC